MRPIIILSILCITMTTGAITMEEWIRQGGKKRDQPYMSRCVKYCKEQLAECRDIAKSRPYIDADKWAKDLHDCHLAYERCLSFCRE